MSVFLHIPTSKWVASNDLAFAIRDKFPVTEGHTLVIPRRPVVDWFGATDPERSALMSLVDVVKADLDKALRPDGYNVGFNSGVAAGQTVMHLHLHVIPRRSGDMDDPRGGVRHVIPSRGNYLSPVAAPPEDTSGFLEKVLSLLDTGRVTSTYKYAVLLGLIDLCLEVSSTAGLAPTSVTTRQLADRVVEIYWPQLRLFDAALPLLRQNSDQRHQGRIVAALRGLRIASPSPDATLGQVRLQHPEAYERCVIEVERTLIKMPLPKLQRFGDDVVEDRFLYEIAWSDDQPLTDRALRSGSFDNAIRFKRGVAERLASFASTLRPAIEQRWVAKVAALNDLPSDRLRDFLFLRDRESTGPVREGLRELHRGSCFYCAGNLGRDFEVDHFIPWARHPDNALDNLVPADRRCNNAKRDLLASEDHLAKWLERSRTQTRVVDEIARAVLWPRDKARTLAVGRSIYGRIRAGARLWAGPEVVKEADPTRIAALLAGVTEAPLVPDRRRG